jgi:hypothetical protein
MGRAVAQKEYGDPFVGLERTQDEDEVLGARMTPAECEPFDQDKVNRKLAALSRTQE